MASTDGMDMNFSKLWEMVRDREAWHAAVHGVTKSRTRLNNNNTNDHVTESLNSNNPKHFSHEISVYPFLMKKLKLEYSVIKNPPANAGDVRNTGSNPGSGRPTPVFLPEKPHGQRSLAGHSPWGHKESHVTEQLILS